MGGGGPSASGGVGGSGFGSTRSPGGTGYGGDLGGYGVAGEMNGGAGGAGMAGYGGGGINGVRGSGWGGSGGGAGAQPSGGSYAVGADGRLNYVGATATQQGSSNYNNPAAARIGGYAPTQQQQYAKTVTVPGFVSPSAPTTMPGYNGGILGPAAPASNPPGSPTGPHPSFGYGFRGGYPGSGQAVQGGTKGPLGGGFSAGPGSTIGRNSQGMPGNLSGGNSVGGFGYSGGRRTGL